MTKAAKHFGKRIQDFWDNKDTKEYTLALCKTIHANQRELFMAKAGYNGGTWAHHKLAVFFARWLDMEAKQAPALPRIDMHAGKSLRRINTLGQLSTGYSHRQGV